jgi:protein FRA10AC1
VLLSRADASFIRDDEEPGEVSWEERLARAYESKLFKEFALVRDLSLLRHLAS